MSLRVRVLASGSSGNAALYSAGRTHVLLDCGISAKRVVEGLALEGLAPEELAGVFITHEHKDHVQGLRVFLKKRKIPLFIAPESWETPNCQTIRPWSVEPIEGGTPVQLGPLTITPFNLPHDAASCLGFVFKAGGVKVVHVTDLGTATTLVRDRARNAHCMMLEFNHDLDRLLEGPYPLELKMRVHGNLGHLSNKQASKLLRDTVNGDCRALFLMHLSRENNLPELALLAAKEALNNDGVRLRAASPDRAADPWEG